MGAVATSSVSWTTVTTATENLLGLCGTMIDTVVANPILAAFFVSGLIGIAIGIVSRLKNA